MDFIGFTKPYPFYAGINTRASTKNIGETWTHHFLIRSRSIAPFYGRAGNWYCQSSIAEGNGINKII